MARIDGDLRDMLMAVVRRGILDRGFAIASQTGVYSVGEVEISWDEVNVL